MAVRVSFLGTGDAFNARARCHASYLISTPSTLLMLDCGPTALLAMKRDGHAVEAVDAVVLSHLHGDHFAGLPFFFLTYIFDAPRTRPLPFELRFVEASAGMKTTVGPVELLPFAVPHQATEISLGYRLAVEGKTILYSGDSGWTEALVTQSRGTDLFICECCFYETRVDFHLDYPRIAENRQRFGCQRLVLTHVGREVLAHRDEIREQISHDGLEIEL